MPCSMTIVNNSLMQRFAIANALYINTFTENIEIY